MDNAPGLLAYARSLTHNEDDAQDLLQDVMLRAIERGGTFRGESSLTTWLHRIMHHRHVDLVRHRDPVLVEPERLAALVERKRILDRPVDRVARLRVDQRRANDAVVRGGLEPARHTAGAHQFGEVTVLTRAGRGDLVTG